MPYPFGAEPATGSLRPVDHTESRPTAVRAPASLTRWTTPGPGHRPAGPRRLAPRHLALRRRAAQAPGYGVAANSAAATPHHAAVATGHTGPTASARSVAPGATPGTFTSACAARDPGSGSAWSRNSTVTT